MGDLGVIGLKYGLLVWALILLFLVWAGFEVWALVLYVVYIGYIWTPDLGPITGAMV